MWVRSKVETAIIDYIQKQQPAVQKYLKDPDMCGCVQRTIDGVVEDIYPTIIEEVRY